MLAQMFHRRTPRYTKPQFLFLKHEETKLGVRIIQFIQKQVVLEIEVIRAIDYTFGVVKNSFATLEFRKLYVQSKTVCLSWAFSFSI